MIDVVAAYIRKNGTVLICQRGTQKARPLKWEFPGGKVEAGETKAEALTRECQEELRIELAIGQELADVIYDYPDITVHLTLLDATIQNGFPIKTEHNDLQWVSPEQFEQYDFCPADQKMISNMKIHKP